jgi:hypothetical protein
LVLELSICSPDRLAQRLLFGAFMSNSPANSEELPTGRFQYSHILRCIGMSLEATELKAVELKCHGDIFIVQGWHRGPFSSVDFEKHYTLEEIAKLDREGRERRKHLPGLPNLLSLSHVLRLAGSYVDRMKGRLVRVSWQDQSDKIQSITVQYEPLQPDRHEQSEHQVCTIDEICLHVYKQRKRIASSDKHSHRPFVSVASNQ